jgi:tRNA(Ile)-lysidine synthase
MDPDMLHSAITTVPPGRWAVGVSGGADSVALLLLLRNRPDLSLHIAHLDHQTRDGQSGEDAAFVSQLADTLGVPCTIGVRSEIESTMLRLLKNTSSRYRKARFGFFRRVVAANHLQGVLLAHHADDQAETVLLRILRGASPAGLAGMRAVSQMQGLEIRRPLLEIQSVQLRDFLGHQSQEWREDASNQSDAYSRNRMRQWLRGRDACVAIDRRSSQEATQASQPQKSLIDLASASESLRDWLQHNAPTLKDSFDIKTLAETPMPLGRHAAARWLVSHGSPAAEVNARTCERLVEMATDAASPARQDFPGGLRVRRRNGQISVDAFASKPLQGNI